MVPRNTRNVEYYEALADDYELFFSDLEENMEEEGIWLSHLLEEHGCRTVLDASCGSGRQAIPLRARGFAVVAADPSEAMLRQAEANAMKHGVHVPFVKVDFANLHACLAHEYDAVVSLGNSLCNLDNATDIQLALQSMYACCRPGGICVIGVKDFVEVRRNRERFHGHRVVDGEDCRKILFELWDVQEPILHSTAYLIVESMELGERTVRSAHTTEYMLEEDELRSLALSAGFASVSRSPTSL